jgi:hypothetical protein
MTNLAIHMNPIMDEVTLYKLDNRKVLGIRLEEKLLGVSFLFDARPEVFFKVEAPNVLHLTWMRNEAAAYLATINNQGRKGA